MTDIAPELLEKVRQSFEAETVILKEEITKGVKNYEEAYSYAIKVGEALSRSFGMNITPEVLPDGRMYYNIADKVVRPMLRAEHELSSVAAVQAQRSANKAAGIGMKPQIAVFDEEKAQGIIDRVSSQPYDEVKWILDEPVKTFSKNVVDHTLEKNVEFQGKSGLHPKIRRTAFGKTCPWCRALAGTYSYPDVPKDVYRRHSNCDCVTEYVDGGKYQDIWSKKEYQSKEEHDAAIQERIARAEERKAANQRKRKPESNKMATTSPNDWSQTTPRVYSPAEFRQIIAHINKRGYKVHDIKEFDGDIALLDKQLDSLDQIQRELPMLVGRRITISVKELDDADFAETNVRTITFNTKALRNEDVTTRNILNNPDFSEKEFADIARHEYGHAYETGREQYFGLEVARQAYYNINGRTPNANELLDAVSSNISVYAIEQDIFGKPCEITSELLCRIKHYPNEYTEEMMRIIRRE